MCFNKVFRLFPPSPRLPCSSNCTHSNAVIRISPDIISAYSHPHSQPNQLASQTWGGGRIHLQWTPIVTLLPFVELRPWCGCARFGWLTRMMRCLESIENIEKSFFLIIAQVTTHSQPPLSPNPIPSDIVSEKTFIYFFYSSCLTSCLLFTISDGKETWIEWLKPSPFHLQKENRMVSAYMKGYRKKWKESKNEKRKLQNNKRLTFKRKLYNNTFICPYNRIKLSTIKWMLPCGGGGEIFPAKLNGHITRWYDMLLAAGCVGIIWKDDCKFLIGIISGVVVPLRSFVLTEKLKFTEKNKKRKYILQK